MNRTATLIDHTRTRQDAVLAVQQDPTSDNKIDLFIAQQRLRACKDSILYLMAANDEYSEIDGIDWNVLGHVEISQQIADGIDRLLEDDDAMERLMGDLG